jgi:hypothetical protein
MKIIASLLSRAVLDGDWTRRTVWTQIILTERRWDSDGTETWRIVWIGPNAALTIANSLCKLASIYAFLSATCPILPNTCIFYFNGRRTHGFVVATEPNDKPAIFWSYSYLRTIVTTNRHTYWHNGRSWSLFYLLVFSPRASLGRN